MASTPPVPTSDSNNGRASLVDTVTPAHPTDENAPSMVVTSGSYFFSIPALDPIPRDTSLEREPHPPSQMPRHAEPEQQEQVSSVRANSSPSSTRPTRPEIGAAPNSVYGASNTVGTPDSPTRALPSHSPAIVAGIPPQRSRHSSNTSSFPHLLNAVGGSYPPSQAAQNVSGLPRFSDQNSLLGGSAGRQQARSRVHVMPESDYSRRPTHPTARLEPAISPTFPERTTGGPSAESAAPANSPTLMQYPNVLSGPENIRGALEPASTSTNVPAHAGVSLVPASSSDSSGQASMPLRPTNIATGSSASTYQDLNIISERPRRPEYALVSQRLSTFDSWPADHHLKKVDLAEAGFFYAGYSDCVRCFYCGVGLVNWEEGDNIWVEHARCYSRCAFLRLKCNKAFVDAVGRVHKVHKKMSLQMVMAEMGTDQNPIKIEENRLTRDSAVSIISNLGFREEDILNAAAKLRETGQIISADALYMLLESMGAPRTVSEDIEAETSSSSPEATGEEALRLREESSRLRSEMTCKVCMDREVSVVFLPCGHLVCCTDCSVALRSCPVCRKLIQGTVRAYLG